MKELYGNHITSSEELLKKDKKINLNDSSKKSYIYLQQKFLRLKMDSTQKL